MSLGCAYVKENEPLRAPDRAARTSFPPSFEGSMTLEAAAAIPLFLFFVMNLLFIFEAIRLQSGLQAALQQASQHRDVLPTERPPFRGPSCFWRRR